jgi:hypothetical protein
MFYNHYNNVRIIYVLSHPRMEGGHGVSSRHAGHAPRPAVQFGRNPPSGTRAATFRNIKEVDARWQIDARGVKQVNNRASFFEGALETFGSRS